MGYGNMAQKVMGIHTRLYARTFMIGNINEPNKPFLFVNTDACMGASLLKLEVSCFDLFYKTLTFKHFNVPKLVKS